MAFNAVMPKAPTADQLRINIDPNNYQTKLPALADVQKEFGLEDPSVYADKIAGANAQSKLDGITAQRGQIDQNLKEGQMAMDVDFFHQFRQQKEQNAQRGLNAGIEAQRGTQLDMNRQGVLGGLLRDANREKNTLDVDSRRVEVERQAEALSIRHTELQSQIDLAFKKGDFLQAENARRMQLDVQKEQSRVQGLQDTFSNNLNVYSKEADNYFNQAHLGLEQQAQANAQRNAAISQRNADRDYSFKVSQAQRDNEYRAAQLNTQKATAKVEQDRAVNKLVLNSASAARGAKTQNDINKIMSGLMNANADGLLVGQDYTDAVNKASKAYTESTYYKSATKHH